MDIKAWNKNTFKKKYKPLEQKPWDKMGFKKARTTSHTLQWEAEGNNSTVVMSSLQLCSINSGRRWTKDSRPSISLCYEHTLLHEYLPSCRRKHLQHALPAPQPSPSACCKLPVRAQPCPTSKKHLFQSPMQSSVSHTHTRSPISMHNMCRPTPLYGDVTQE